MGLGFRVYGLGVHGLKIRVAGCRDEGLGFGVWGLGFRVYGSGVYGFRVSFRV